MMTATRILRGFKCSNRLSEIWRCARKLGVVRACKLTLAFIGLMKLEYPRIISLRDGQRIKLWSWDDLTTVWVVWFGTAYLLRKEDQTILDVGANIGAFTLLAAHPPGRKVIAVEPFPETCERLKENVGIAACGENVEIVQAAVDVTERGLWMSLNADTPSHSRSVELRKPREQAVEVSTVTLKRLIEMAGGSVDYLKVDIEGGEYLLFEGTSPEILQKVSRIGIEYHGKNGHFRLIGHCEKAGFRLRRHWSEGIRGTLEFSRRNRR
jgi:FkbM family methyltransferase